MKACFSGQGAFSCAVFAVALVALLAGCSAPPPVEKPPRTVLVRSVDDGETPQAMTVYTGEVRARLENDVAFRIGGKLVERLVDTGAVVRRGDVLARLDPQDVDLAASAAAAQVAAAQAELALARAELRRHQDLHAAGFISASALDARRTAAQAAEARVRHARAQAAAAGNQAAYAKLVADHDAVVTAAPAEVGQVMAAGQTVLRLAQPDEREVLIHVPESRVRDLALDQTGVVRAWAEAGRSYAASVREIAPSADPATRTYAIRVSVTAADQALPLGATASVVFASAGPMRTMLPLPAVTAIEGRPTVWVVDESSRLQPIAVEIGQIREDGVVILSGLPADSRIVVAGVHKLVTGERVRAVAETASIALDISR